MSVAQQSLASVLVLVRRVSSSSHCARAFPSPGALMRLLLDVLSCPLLLGGVRVDVASGRRRRPCAGRILLLPMGGRFDAARRSHSAFKRALELA